jgi:hypothetical protein
LLFINIQLKLRREIDKWLYFIVTETPDNYGQALTTFICWLNYSGRSTTEDNQDEAAINLYSN